MEPEKVSPIITLFYSSKLNNLKYFHNHEPIWSEHAR
jgi:hypothetical protein